MTHSTVWVKSFYVPLHTKQVILETIFSANLLASTKETKSNITKATTHQEYEDTITENKHKN